jgi:hypothetical protein
LLPPPALPRHCTCTPQFRTYKIIYRRYAGLFFSFCVDVTDNELSYLEAIHLFVEMLDRFFGNVCELDLVFNFHKVRRRQAMHRGQRQSRRALHGQRDTVRFTHGC